MGKLATCRLKRRIVFIPEEDAASTTENVSERIIKGLLKEFSTLFDNFSLKPSYSRSFSPQGHIRSGLLSSEFALPNSSKITSLKKYNADTQIFDLYVEITLMHHTRPIRPSPTSSKFCSASYSNLKASKAVLALSLYSAFCDSPEFCISRLCDDEHSGKHMRAVIKVDICYSDG